MMRKMLRVAAAAVLVAACEDGGTEVPGVPVARVEVAAPSATVEARATLQLSARATGADGSELPGRPVAWSSSDTLLAAVSPAGLVSARAPGTVTIRAASGGREGQTVLTILPVAVAWVQVTPAGDLVRAPGTTLQLGAIARAQDGTELPGRAATWTSSDTAVAVVSAAGVLQARAAGSARITAAVEEKTGEAVVLVPSLVHRIEVDADTLKLGAGDEARITARARAADGAVLERTLTWTSSNPSVASVSESGVVRGVGSGVSLVTASGEGRSATVLVRVDAWGRRALVAVNDSALPAVAFRRTETGAGGTARTIRFQVGSGGLRLLGLTERYELRMDGFHIPPDSPPVAASYVSRGTFTYDVWNNELVLTPDSGPGLRGRPFDNGTTEINWQPDPAAPAARLLIAAP